MNSSVMLNFSDKTKMICFLCY